MSLKKTRLLLCTSSMDGGGAERQLLYLLHHLDRSRFDLQLYLLYRSGALLPEVPEDVAITSYWDRHSIPRWNWPGRVLSSQIRDLQRTLLANRIDVTYDRLFHMTLVSGPATRNTSVKRVSAIVSPPEFDVTRSEKKWLQFKKKRLRDAYMNADVLQAVGQGTAINASRFYEIPQDRFMVLPSPIDVERIDKERKRDWMGVPLVPNCKHIVSVGRLSDEKGHRFLIEGIKIYERFVQLDQSPPVVLHLVGDGVLKRELQSLANSMGVHNVHFHGHLSSPFSLLSRCDLMVLPSLYEGMPNALLEAMICRVPVMATDTEQGAGELLRAHPLGHLVSKGNAQAIANGIRDRFSNPREWLGRIEIARDYVVRNHSLQNWIAIMSDVFQRTVNLARD